MTRQEMKDLEKFLESQEGQVSYLAHELERIVTALEVLNDNQTTIDLLDSESESIAQSACRLLIILHPHLLERLDETALDQLRRL